MKLPDVSSKEGLYSSLLGMWAELRRHRALIMYLMIIARGNATRFVLIRELEDTLQCYRHDDEDKVSIYVAKSLPLRDAVATRIVGAERQVILPGYSKDKIIYAVKVLNGTGVETAPKWLEIAQPAMWAEVE